VLGDSDAGLFINPGNRLVEVTDGWFAADPLAGLLPLAFSETTQLCRVSLTSGATGIPKIVFHTVQEIGRRINGFIEINWNSVLCLPGLSSNWGFMTACATLATGRTLCFAQSPFQAVRMIELFSIDFVMASTEQLLALARVARKSGAQLKNLRTVWLSGSLVTRALLEAAMTYLCKDIVCRYAASETGLIAQATASEVLSKPGLVGHVVPGVEVAIFDPHGRKCPPGEIGSVKVRINEDSIGHALNRDADEGSWIDLGDVGWLTFEDQLSIVGRKSDVSPIGPGEEPAQSISPVHEVEHILRLEWDATDAAAVIIDDGASGAQPEIWIGIVDNKDASADKLAAILRKRGIDYRIQLFDLNAIPRSSNGKVNREQLKALLLASMAGSGGV